MQAITYIGRGSSISTWSFLFFYGNYKINRIITSRKQNYHNKQAEILSHLGNWIRNLQYN